MVHVLRGVDFNKTMKRSPDYRAQVRREGGKTKFSQNSKFDFHFEAIKTVCQVLPYAHLIYVILCYFLPCVDQLLHVVYCPIVCYWLFGNI